MQIKNIFLKPVDRPIEGVIKADDDKCLYQEVEEYVLTNEVEKRLELFLEAYNNNDNSNGVWISGFFGSGKSHLLKMLALLLENRKVGEKDIVDLFLEKCTNNEILAGDLKRLTKTPSKSILFNIDQKADVISKTQVDALLSVFVKVFDEMCGYYGKQGHIARFERDLDSRNLYQRFKNAFKEISTHDWETGREQALIESPQIAQAYAAVTGASKESADGILDKYRHEYKVSIEDFADNVKKFIDAQTPDFRLNFLVDEVGQYIAGNIKLMLNLQTIAETLATKCRGRAWLIVTAQEDMDAVVGEMNKQQLNDFTKIMARFACRIKLTSKNVDEVIKTRLLAKTDPAIDGLSKIYHEQQNNFKTLFDFVDGAQHYSNYRDRDDFVRAYPFVSYQFTLFQSCIKGLSEHNAFEGKHSSVGERSMLSVFQQVAMQIVSGQLGELATFDRMFDGICNSLKSQIQRAIGVADKHLNNPFAVRILKALLLVKYVKEYRATPRNLRVLMQDAFTSNIKNTEKKIEEALDQLEQQTYIQRNGDVYEYLTDEEKDIEQEIKDADIESSDIIDRLQDMIFVDVLKQSKINHEASGWSYSFSKKLDGRLYGHERELAINVITPFNDLADKTDTLRMQSMTTDELMVVMPLDPKFMKDITLFMQTEKYIKQKNSLTQQESIRRILQDKSQQNNSRRTGLLLRLKDLLGQSALLVRGGNVENGTTDPQTRIIKGFHELINKIYPNMRMLGANRYSEDKIANFIREDRLLIGTQVLGEAETEMLNLIQGNNMSAIKTTLKSFIDRFEKKPYGWPLPAIQCLLARLCVMGKVDARVDSNALEGRELENALKNTQSHGNVILHYQADFTPSQIRQVKEYYKELFNEPAKSLEAKALGKETAEAVAKMCDELMLLIIEKEQFPFLAQIAEPLNLLKTAKDKNYSYYFTDFKPVAERLIDCCGGIINPIRQFMNGPLREIYDQTKTYLMTQEHNFAHVTGEEVNCLRELINSPFCYKGNGMQQAKQLLEALRQKIQEKLNAETKQAVGLLQQYKDQVVEMPLFAALPDNEKALVTMKFDSLMADIQQTALIPVIKDMVARFQDNEYLKILSQLEQTKSSGPEPARNAEYIMGRSIAVKFEKPVLITAEDVEEYALKFKQAMLNEIRAGRRIKV
ncbi:MAG: BREX system P-loop protein BrxC [Deltaproteobacteria bacterium]|nr:BREX system P-loop protein BrxC [Deltaproteobacteria bacterium]